MYTLPFGPTAIRGNVEAVEVNGAGGLVLLLLATFDTPATVTGGVHVSPPSSEREILTLAVEGVVCPGVVGVPDVRQARYSLPSGAKAGWETSATPSPTGSTAIGSEKVAPL